jgi:hypothetical protein
LRPQLQHINPVVQAFLDLANETMERFT